MEEPTLVIKMLNIISPLFPVLLTGLITFFITKYTQNRNIPLDKLEIAYDRVYYPISKIMKACPSENIDHEMLQNKMENILLKYDKYISQSTINTYNNYLIRYQSSDKKTNRYFSLFCSNILSYNSKYRFKLGYPQDNVIENYKYLEKRAKRAIKSVIGLLIGYLLIAIYDYFSFKWIVYITLMILFYIMYTVLCMIFEFIIYMFENF
jgi:hypothetical protein